MESQGPHAHVSFMNIISASRRTDIPAYYTEWFIRRVKEGYAFYPNPFGGSLHRVSLLPEDVHTIVFWSKNFAPLLPYVRELQEKGYGLYFHYTITGAPRNLEPDVPPWEWSMEVLKEMASRVSPEQIAWRFDPIIFTPELDLTHYIERFRILAAHVSGLARRCFVSFATIYSKVKRRLSCEGIQWREPETQEKEEIAWRLLELARKYGIEIMFCCQEDLVARGFPRASCIDGKLLSSLFPWKTPITVPGGTRPGCGCTLSRDVGMYDTCPAGCVYCYANISRKHAMMKKHKHQLHSESLMPISDHRPHNKA